MTSATLYREGENLDALLAELDEQHPGRVRVVEVTYPRTGGIGGFFAKQKVGVEYVLQEPEATRLRPRPKPGTRRPQPRPTDASPLPRPQTSDPLEELLAAADERDNLRSPLAAGTGGSNAEFAKLLLELAAKKAHGQTSRLIDKRPQNYVGHEVCAIELAVESSDPEAVEPPVVAAEISQPEPQQFEAFLPEVIKLETEDISTEDTEDTEDTDDIEGTEEIPFEETGADEPQREPSAEAIETEVEVSAEAPQASTTDELLTLRRQLVELGVPIDWIPSHAPHPYAVVQDLVARLPEVGALPNADGAVLAIVGPSKHIAAAVDHMTAKLRLRTGNIWTTRAGIGSEQLVTDAWQIAPLVAELRAGTESGPALFAIVTDDSDDVADDYAELIATLNPDALWVHVDATRKSTDTRAQLTRLGTPTGLIVTGAAATASPATVWELDVPTALLDGRPATASAWAVLLLDKLAELSA